MVSWLQKVEKAMAVQWRDNDLRALMMMNDDEWTPKEVFAQQPAILIHASSIDDTSE